MDVWTPSKHRELANAAWHVELCKITPGCCHIIKCSKGCLYRWGILHILVLSGFSSKQLKRLENYFENPIRLARVT